VAKKFSRLAIARHILRPLRNYHIPPPLQTLDQELVGRRVPSPFLTPLDAFSISILGALGASGLAPTFQTKVTPLAGPQASRQLNPALQCID